MYWQSAHASQRQNLFLGLNRKCLSTRLAADQSRTSSIHNVRQMSVLGNVGQHSMPVF